MRNILAYLAGGLILASFVGLVITGGLLDAPHSPIMPGALAGLASVCTLAAGGLLAQIYERGRKSCSK